VTITCATLPRSSSINPATGSRPSRRTRTTCRAGEQGRQARPGAVAASGFARSRGGHRRPDQRAVTAHPHRRRHGPPLGAPLHRRTAGISRPIGPHALRRTVGLNQGVPVADIQPLLRHARPETTLASSDISPDAPERHTSHQVAGLPSVRRLTSTMAPTLPSPSASEPSGGAEPSGRARDTTRGSPRASAKSRIPGATCAEAGADHGLRAGTDSCRRMRVLKPSPTVRARTRDGIFPCPRVQRPGTGGAAR
jgi:hypothetical protein